MSVVQPSITVLTSAYNAEKTITRTINSVLAQTYTNFEYIVINHGSTDGTKKIISSFVIKDQRVQLLDLPENLGCPAKALNIGMKLAQGEYLCFIDADDEYMPDFLEVMIVTIKKNNADVVACSRRDHYMTDYLKTRMGGEYIDWTFATERIFKTKNDYEKCWLRFLNGFTHDFGSYDVYWNKIYRSEYLRENGIKLPEDFLYYADALFNDAVYKTFPVCAFINYVGYLWHIGGNSVSYSFNINQVREMLVYVNSHYQWIKLFPSTDTKYIKRWLIVFITSTFMLKKSNVFDDAHLNILQELLTSSILRELFEKQPKSTYCFMSKWVNDIMALFYENLSEQINYKRCVIYNKIESETGNTLKSTVLDDIFDNNNHFSLGNISLLDAWGKVNLEKG